VGYLTPVPGGSSVLSADDFDTSTVDIPAAVSLDVASMSSLATGEIHDYIIYGVS
jgi:hypothetical protein